MARTTAEAEPAGHACGAEPEGQKKPGEQGGSTPFDTCAPAGQLAPAVHVAQALEEAAPTSVEKDPAGQGVQAVEPAAAA